MLVLWVALVPSRRRLLGLPREASTLTSISGAVFLHPQSESSRPYTRRCGRSLGPPSRALDARLNNNSFRPQYFQMDIDIDLTDIGTLRFDEKQVVFNNLFNHDFGFEFIRGEHGIG